MFHTLIKHGFLTNQSATGCVMLVEHKKNSSGDLTHFSSVLSTSQVVYQLINLWSIASMPLDKY